MVDLPTRDGLVLVPVEIRRSKRSRYIRVWVGQDHQAVLSIPWHTRFHDALDFLKGQGDWLMDQLNAQPKPLSLLEFLQERKVLTAAGQTWPIRFKFRGHRTALHWQRSAGFVDLHLNPHTETEAALVKTVRTFAKRALTERTQSLMARSGLPQYRVKVVVRDQASRWGSCSSSGQISLNWRLVLLAPRLQDYVIYHELAHVTEMNHSKRFWDLLGKYDPHSKRHDRELNRVSKKVIQVGRI